jgi:DNA-binding XRE family transcriptional regulator
MQVHVKTPRTKINIEGEISTKLLKALKEDFGEELVVEDDEWVIATETQWYKKTKARMKPGDHMRAYRLSRGLTQPQLGKILAISKQNISDMEHGRRTIGKEVARKLADIFKTSVEKFL